MLATFWLLGLVLGASQTARPAPTTPPAVRADWVLTPRLVRGQELVYRGTFDEQATGSRVQFQRGYRFEARYFVLGTPSSGVDLVALTSLRERTPAASTAQPAAATAVRLEKLRLDLAGKVSAEPEVSLAVPLEGAPSVEVGPFLDLPQARLAVGKGWEVSEPGRPVVAWRIAGTESIAGQSCVKVVGIQQSDEWERPRADRGAWRRQETLWISPRTGIAVRVERILEQREPARRETARRSELRYDLESDLSYPQRLAEDRRQEIIHALSFRDTARPMLSEPGKHARPLATLQKRIALHLENHPPTPYREAVLLVRRQVEAAARGEVVSVVHHETARATTTARVGEVAPDFVATEITGTGSARLAKWKGKAILLVFYQPTSSTAADLLRFAQEAHATLGSKYVQVVGLSVSDDTTAVLKQRTALKLGFPILHGGGLRISYGVETTPRLVVIDSAGVVRAAYTGWGSETATEVLAEVRRWLPGQ
jgi:peroxiredoxin